MTLSITKHSETFSSCAQLSPEDMSEVAALGFKAVINARPDQESGPEQPLNASIQAAAQKAGLHYVHIPVVPNNIQPSDIAACARFTADAPTPILGFCKTGRRATSLYQSAQQPAQSGMAKQNGLKQKIKHFFANKCLLTKLYRKLALK